MSPRRNRLRLTLVACLLWATTAQAQVTTVTEVGTAIGTVFSDSTETITLDPDPASGEAVVVQVAIQSASQTFNTPTGDANITFAAGSLGCVDDGVNRICHWIGVASGTVASVTLTTSGNPNGSARVNIIRLQGNAAASIEDAESESTAAATTNHDTDISVTATVDGAILQCTLGTFGAYTIDGDFTALSAPPDGANGGVCGYDIVTAAAYGVVNTTAANEDTVTQAIVIKGNGAGAVTCGRGMTLLGAGKCD